MALSLTELEVTTQNYFKLDNGKAYDIFTQSSWLQKFLLDQQKGLYMEPPGGRQIEVPLEYDEAVGGFYSKGDTLNSDDRNMIYAALFDWKHIYGNATVYRIDGLKNRGEFAEVSIIQQRLKAAQKIVARTIADSIYDAPTGDGERLTGLLHLCNETSTLAYGGFSEDDLVSSDGSKHWEGKVTTTTEQISRAAIKTMARNAKLRDGAEGRINLVVTTETLFDAYEGILQAQQRFVKAEEVVKAGFVGLEDAGRTIVADDFCPSGYAFGLNTNYVGFAVHPDGKFMRTPWRLIEGSPEDKTMKIYWDGNLVCANRKGQIAHSNLS